MDILIDRKTRIECTNIQEAADLRHQFGGRIAWENNVPREESQAIWYSWKYLPTEILSDLKGSYTIQ